ncbi:hypothetical protein V6x_47350 [Gimesia chilikensis]|uniref:Uncharacterized protein n=1 Tax=Gimesia chilikensis TaxID=2605989 RepID=A0A517WIB9_9PLAN|nr:hypothetical protein V6x_47350 [Gimesia chilikensis]
MWSPAVIDIRWGQSFASFLCLLRTGELSSTLARRVGTQANPYIVLPYIDLFEAIGWHRWLVVKTVHIGNTRADTWVRPTRVGCRKVITVEEISLLREFLNFLQ